MEVFIVLEKREIIDKNIFMLYLKKNLICFWIKVELFFFYFIKKDMIVVGCFIGFLKFFVLYIFIENFFNFIF